MYNLRGADEVGVVGAEVVLVERGAVADRHDARLQHRERLVVLRPAEGQDLGDRCLSFYLLLVCL